MGKRKRSENRVEDRRSEETYLLAKKLVRLRNQLKVKRADVAPGSALSVSQQAEVDALKSAILKTKGALVQRGVSPTLLSNRKRLAAALKSATAPTEKKRRQSPGVGMYRLGSTLKHWKS